MNELPGTDDVDAAANAHSAPSAMIDRHGASPHVEDAAPPEKGNGGGGGSPLGDSDSEYGTDDDDGPVLFGGGGGSPLDHSDPEYGTDDDDGPVDGSPDGSLEPGTDNDGEGPDPGADADGDPEGDESP